MVIGVISDTHGFLDDKIKKFFSDCTEIWHSGDWGDYKIAEELRSIAPVRGVYGNIDGIEIRNEFPEYQVFVSGGMRILLIHIGGYPGKYESKVRQIIYQQQPDIFVCGHSHILKVMHDPKYNVLHINPGAAGNSGFHKVKTVIKFLIESGNITDMKILEIDRKK